MPERWKVINVQERMTADPELGIIELTVVRFRTATGYMGMIEMPKAEATSEALRTAIDDEVKRIEEIEKLSG